MSTFPITTLTRSCPATTVPYGETVTLDAGGEVQVVQQLGGSITVRTELGRYKTSAAYLKFRHQDRHLANGSFTLGMVASIGQVAGEVATIRGVLA